MTTTSSVFRTRSTTSPKRRPSACSTATYTSRSPLSSVLTSSVSPRCTSGSRLPRNRYTGAPIACSITRPDCPSRYTSSCTATCGITYRWPAHSTVSAWMIASVSGMVSRQTVPTPDRRVDLDGTADAFDVGLDDVHADAAAGHVGHRGGGREAGPEDEREDLAAVHAREGVPRDDAAFDRDARDLVRVHAGAVVGDLDDDVSTLVVRPERQYPLGRLADREPVGGRLDAVVDRVAHQVGQRVLDRLEQAAVELGLPADHGEAYLLAAGGGEVPHDAGQLRPEVVDRLHAGLHHGFLQLRRDEVEPLTGTEHRRFGDRADRPYELVAGQHQLTDEPHERVQQVDVDADRRVGHRPPRATAFAVRCGCRRGVRYGGRRRGRHRLLFKLGLRLDVGLHQHGRFGGSGCAAAAGGCGRRGCGRRGCRGGRRVAVRDARGDRDDDRLDVDVAFPAELLDRRQQHPYHVDHAQQSVGHLRGHRLRAVAQPRQQRLPNVRHPLEPVEGQEPGRTLDRVDRPEDRRQQLARSRCLLQSDQVAVQLVEVLMRLDQELRHDVAKIVHGPSPLRLPPHRQ